MLTQSQTIVNNQSKAVLKLIIQDVMLENQMMNCIQCPHLKIW